MGSLVHTVPLLLRTSGRVGLCCLHTFLGLTGLASLIRYLLMYDTQNMAVLRSVSNHVSIYNLE